MGILEEIQGCHSMVVFPKSISFIFGETANDNTRTSVTVSPHLRCLE